ncbi:hypothetical protein PORY_001376 [Pneumocystis oryctolagi]|uniref:Uncharacterized protein n=1 Tax=Pneumocystis oryctolagi TaxID=42067 RepID=A0ACB7CBS7_9ASCO|nr:hypothetical protein PORY_001376 [Pneumocystis oryctolagi]
MSKEHKKIKKHKYNKVKEKFSSQEIKKKEKKRDSKKKKNKSKKEDALLPINPFLNLKIESYISIPPIYSCSPMKGIQYYLDTMILSYLPSIQGIMLAHRNCKFIDKTAKIYNESPFAFAWVQFEMLVWRTKTGDFIEGTVNLQSPSHIGLLVSGFFNASIPKKAIPKNWMYQEVMSQKEVEQNENGYWIDQDKKAVKIGDKISFWTVKLETIGGIVSIEGTLLSKKYTDK